jgi:hypothetical protein
MKGYRKTTDLTGLTCTRMRGLCEEGKGTVRMKWEMCLLTQKGFIELCNEGLYAKLIFPLGTTTTTPAKEHFFFIYNHYHYYCN